MAVKIPQVADTNPLFYRSNPKFPGNQAFNHNLKQTKRSKK